MQLTAKKKANTISPVNVASLKNAAKTPLEKTVYYTLLKLLAEGCDSNANGINFYCTLGCTKDGTSLSLSVNLDGERQTVYAINLLDLSVAVSDMLDAP